MEKVRNRNATDIHNMSHESPSATVLSGSMLLAKQRLQAVTEQKMQEAQSIKKDLAKKLKKREKQDNAILKHKMQ